MQSAQLRRALDIAPKNDEATRLNPPKQIGGFGIEFGPGHAGKEWPKESDVTLESVDRRIVIHTVARLNSIMPAENKKRI